MGIFKYIKNKIDEKIKARENIIRQREQEQHTIQQREKLTKSFYSTLSSFNSYKKSSIMQNIYGHRLYQLYSRLDIIGQQKIESEKGKPLILLIEKEHRKFIEAENEDLIKNKLTSNHKKIQMIAFLSEKEGVLFKDNENNLYCGEFFNLKSYKYAQEMISVYDDYQTANQYFYLGPECDPEDYDYTYYNDLDILIRHSTSYTHYEREDDWYGGYDEYGSNTIRYDDYLIEYNVSKKVSLFNSQIRKNKYKETMLRLHKEGYVFEMTETEINYINNVIMKEKEQAEKAEKHKKRIEELKAIQYDGAIMEDYFRRGESGGVCYIDDSLYKVGDVVVDNNGNVLIVCSRTTIDGLFAEQYKDRLGTVVRMATKDDIKNAKNKI